MVRRTPDFDLTVLLVRTYVEMQNGDWYIMYTQYQYVFTSGQLKNIR